MKETDAHGEMVHKEIIGKVPNAHELDTLLFNELLNMLKGDVAITRYIAQNVKRSGVEIWRKLNRNNDPKTYATTDGYRRMIEQLASTRCKDEKELRDKFEKLEAAFDQYMIVSGKEYNSEDKLHRMVDILPANVYHQLSATVALEDWTYANLKSKIVDLSLIHI